MCEVVSWHFYIPKGAGPTSENTFCSTKNLALSDRIGFKKIQDGVVTGEVNACFMAVGRYIVTYPNKPYVMLY